jgi:hypothetical protein
MDLDPDLESVVVLNQNQNPDHISESLVTNCGLNLLNIPKLFVKSVLPILIRIRGFFDSWIRDGKIRIRVSDEHLGPATT